MSEQQVPGAAGSGAVAAAAGESERTGVPAVDAVLDEVADLDELPLVEHAAVFERAHEQLRRALDAGGPGDDSAPA